VVADDGQVDGVDVHPAGPRAADPPMPVTVTSRAGAGSRSTAMLSCRLPKTGELGWRVPGVPAWTGDHQKQITPFERHRNTLSSG